MGHAIGKALAKNKEFKVFAYDKHRQNIKAPKVRYAELSDLQKFDTVVIAVKPQDVPALAGQLAGKINPQSILISIAAGLPIKKISGLFRHQKIVRMMPNLGLAVGQGIATWKAAGLSSTDKKIAGKILNSITENFEVSDESLIDATTAISGSGPAYFFFLARALEASAKNLGLSAAQSRMLVEKTLSASAKLQADRGITRVDQPDQIKKGTTEAALKVFKKRSLNKIITEAVTAASNWQARSSESGSAGPWPVLFPMRQAEGLHYTSKSMANLTRQLQKTKLSSARLAGLSFTDRNRLLRDIADAIKKNSKQILSANQKDLKAFGGDPFGKIQGRPERSRGEDEAVRERLELNLKKIQELLLQFTM